MTGEEKKQIEFEIRHIFESGANELRIYNMVVSLVENRERKIIEQEKESIREFLICEGFEMLAEKI